MEIGNWELGFVMRELKVRERKACYVMYFFGAWMLGCFAVVGMGTEH